MMVAGTAAAVGLALVNDRSRTASGRTGNGQSGSGLRPALVEAAPKAPLAFAPAGAPAIPQSGPLDFLAGRLGVATLLGVAMLFLAASVPALTALASDMRATSSSPSSYGPPLRMRAAAGVSGNWEQSYSVAAPDATTMGAALLAGIAEQHQWDVMRAMRILADQEAAAAGDAAAAGRVRMAAAAPYSLDGSSGLAVGTVMTARITIYGCTGPGGGFCNHMSSGGTVFEGAAACSSNLPFGTKLTIDGDPTRRVYECLDRGALAPTWIDVYFENTSDGIAWQSTLGSTVTDIHIVN